VAVQIVAFKIWFTRCRSCCGGKEIVAWYNFSLYNEQMSVFGKIFILHKLWNQLLVLAYIASLILRIDIHSRIPLSKPMHTRPRMKEMYCNENVSCYWNKNSKIFVQLLLSKLHCQVQVFFPFSLSPSWSDFNTIHMIKHRLVDSNNMIQCNCMPVCGLGGPGLEQLQNCLDILHIGPNILCCE